jgi:site-specific recombinase XerD
LSQEEVLNNYTNYRNLKHRAIIALLYSFFAGLRISELINFKVSRFSYRKKQLIVKKWKEKRSICKFIADSFTAIV